MSTCREGTYCWRPNHTNDPWCAKRLSPDCSPLHQLCHHGLFQGILGPSPNSHSQSPQQDQSSYLQQQQNPGSLKSTTGEGVSFPGGNQRGQQPGQRKARPVGPAKEAKWMISYRLFVHFAEIKAHSHPSPLIKATAISANLPCRH